MDNKLYWVWLTVKPEIKPKMITSLLERYNSVTEIYNERSFSGIPDIGSRELTALKDKSLAEARRIIDETEGMGGHILTYDDEQYPQKLKNIIPIPYVLYYAGEYINADDTLAIGIIGARKGSEYGKTVTLRISKSLAEAGVTVISGLARGNDAYSAIGALRAGGKVIGVLGFGLDIVYPKENAGLIDDVIHNGMVITEYPLGSRALPAHFPERNRIISGLSNGVLVTEAGNHSGTFITVRQAVESGRDVFAIPRGLLERNDMSFQGTNRLIQQGAKLVTNAADVLEEYSYMELTPVKPAVPDKNDEIPDYDNASYDNAGDNSSGYDNTGENNVGDNNAGYDNAGYDNTGDNNAGDDNTEKGEKTAADNIKSAANDTPKRAGKAVFPDNLSDIEKQIVDNLVYQDMNIDELSLKLDISAGFLSPRLTILEVRGIIERLPGGYFRIVINN